MNKRIVVIGGGPAGIMAAATAASCGADVTLIEKNNILGKKLLITGKGRCNVTNFCDVDNVLKNINSSNPKFMYKALNSFSCYDTYSFFEQLGVELKVERGNRVFPVSDKAVDIRNALKEYAIQNGVEIINDVVIGISSDPFTVSTRKYKYIADAIIIATGGKSYPLTGSTGDGYKFAKQFGHTIVKPEPSLVGLMGSEQLCSSLAGLSLKNVSVKFFDSTNNLIYSDFGEMLFTHIGVSGPVVLSASAKIDFSEGPVDLFIDLKPALSFEELDKRILSDFSLFNNKDFVNSLNDLFPKKIIPVVIEKSGIPPRTKVNSITKLQRKKLVEVIKNFKIVLHSKSDFDEAIITAGGVSTTEIDPKTMQSLKKNGLFFAGEVIDVDANTGGFNLQIAFSTGYLAGKSCLED